MFYEISVDANQFIEQSLLGKDQVTRNALRPIRRMRDKLDGLGFLDYRVAPVVNTIDELLAKIPNKGAIAGGILQEILATALLLADPAKTRRHGEGLLAVQILPKAVIVEDEVAEWTVDALESLLCMPTSVTVPAHLPVPVPERSTSADEIPNVIIDDSAQNSNGFSDLFDGIFDDDTDSDDESNLEVVTSADIKNESTDQDYWF
jgi:hypothetical protein